MLAFTRLQSVAVPLALDNVDTDQILPARFLAQKRELGYGPYCFRDLRYQADGAERPDFVLNQDPYRGAQVLIAGSNFGCGSSREGAVYALQDIGVRAVIAESFGDIFYQNALINGLLPIHLPAGQMQLLLAGLRDELGMTVEIDLAGQTVATSGGAAFDFPIDAFRKHCLLEGLDEIDFTINYIGQIEQYEAWRQPM
ncbi:3-isopropylmalate dehydratase small subunit [Phreatobacter stygius]|uniref:3-isopropylmalate dehydratase small subunit n=1 Tax=Phreatobacter stygius TaxID=1940610 RepID=A0A4D7B048_9HYPH|nr:3-isopropylmalate dehydratase small subunit [Phreatobacter stygius]QCI64403.1 3-isopropylmalate dehydratase small subunit [Phreatobacter stygius]